MSALKKIARSVSFPVVKALCRLCYDKKYLQGRFFQGPTPPGWRWVLRSILFQKILGYNRQIPWPVSPLVLVQSAKNIDFDPDDLNIFHANGVYYGNYFARITIGKGTYLGHNVGIITANHDPNNLQEHTEGRDVVIGKGCWIGMNAVVLPGVRLGDRTIVGANAVVTKSFPEGNCVIGGIPAKLIRTLDASGEKAQ